MINKYQFPWKIWEVDSEDTYGNKTRMFTIDDADGNPIVREHIRKDWEKQAPDIMEEQRDLFRRIVASVNALARYTTEEIVDGRFWFDGCDKGRDGPQTIDDQVDLAIKSLVYSLKEEAAR